MAIEINENEKTYIVWLDSLEADKPLPKYVIDEMLSYKRKKFTVAVIRSGDYELEECMAGLLSDNRRKMAENQAMEDNSKITA